MTDDLATIGRDLGRIFEALSALPFVSLLVAFVWSEFYTLPALFIAGLVPLGIGHYLVTRHADARNPNKLQGMMVAAAGWFFVAVFGSLPFTLIAWTVALDPIGIAPPLTSTLAAFLNPVNGFFESMSGFTGSGLTMADNEAVLPATLQWWRSLTQWIGGVGVIVLTTAVLARPGSGSLTLYEGEARSDRIHPSIVSTVRTIWWIFLLFTFLSILLLWLAGMPIWGAVNHGMTGLATGGFSITDDSIATYDSALIDFALLPVMTLGSIAFPIHYLILQGDLKNFYTDLQTRWVFGFFAIGTVSLVALLLAQGPYETPFAAVRYGAFQFVSAASCTGFQTAISLGTAWSPAAQLVVLGAMIVGAAAGSTVGGIKLIRAITLVKGTIYRIQGVFYPERAIRRFHIGDRKLTDIEASREFEEAAIVAFLWVVFLGLGIFVLLAVVSSEFTLENVIFEVTSAQGNVGLSTGITVPGMSRIAKWMLIFNMWIGRLEIIPVLVLIRGIFRGFDLYR